MGVTCSFDGRPADEIKISKGEEPLAHLRMRFTSWEEEALEDVLNATDRNVTKAEEMILAWSTEEHPQGTFFGHSHGDDDDGKGLSMGLRRPTFVLDQATQEVLPRASYDATMAKRLSRNLTRRNTKPLKKSESGICRHTFSSNADMAHKHVMARQKSQSLKCSSQVALPRPEYLESDGNFADGVPDGYALTEEDLLSGGVDPLLRQRLEMLSMVVKVMGDDGNCQFRAMSMELFGTQERHGEVRDIAVAHMKKRPEDFQVYFEEEEFDEYLRGMSQPRTWGDELTLRAVTDALCVKIHVITTEQENWYLHYDPVGEPVRELFLTYLSPIHYNTLRPLQ